MCHLLNLSLLPTLLLTCVAVGEIALTHPKNHVNQVSGKGKENAFSQIPSVSCFSGKKPGRTEFFQHSVLTLMQSKNSE